MSKLYKTVVSFSHKHPIVRGMTAYAVLWPTSSLIQQTIDKKEFGNYDWHRAARFGLFGSLFVAPTLYGWIRISSRIWPGKDLLTAVKKGVIEQLTYGPFASVAFFFTMSALEGNTYDVCIEEVKVKFLPTYKVAMCVWPFLATINHRFIKERNRVAFVSVCSMIWTCFLAHMKNLDQQEVIDRKNAKKIGMHVQ